MAAWEIGLLECTGLVFAVGAAVASSGSSNYKPPKFVYLEEIAPNIRQEVRYATSNNFLGEAVDGYRAARVLVTRPAADALKDVQQALEAYGLGLKIYDGYRPQRAVDHFIRWAKDPDRQDTKARYYPEVDKEDLLRKGYLAEMSGHSRGSTVDVTILSLDNGMELDMGTGFDHFGPKSWVHSSRITAQQRANRMLLQNLMQQHGFVPLEQEWWHFTLKDEPYPDTYFDFIIE